MSDANPLLETIAAVVEQGQKVHAIDYIVDSELANGPVAVKIAFGDSSLCVSVCAVDDTVQVSQQWPDEFAGHDFVRMSLEEEPWCEVSLAVLTWGWILTNHLGYADGVQLEFRPVGENRLVCIQLIALASTLELRLVGRANIQTQLGR